MQIYDNKFYILFAASSIMRAKYFYDTATGKLDTTNTVTGGYSSDKVSIIRNKRTASIIQMPATLYYTSCDVLLYDAESNYLGYKNIDAQTIELPSDVSIIAINIYPKSAFDDTQEVEFCNYGFLAHPHYSSLNKKYEKESNQMFFRETLDGKVTFYNEDYDLVSTAQLEDKMYLNLYYNNVLYISNTFSKTDCKIDYAKKYVEPSLTANDQYTELLNNYENTYDLIKLAPALSKLTLTTRMLLQIYVQGDGNITNFIGGTYWESETSEEVDSAKDLKNKYYFSRNKVFQEIHLEDFSISALNTTYKTIEGAQEWPGENANQTYTSKIVLVKEFAAGDAATDKEIGAKYYNLNTSEGTLTKDIFALHNGTFDSFAKDVYRIYVQISGGGVTTNLYASANLYVDFDGTLALGQGGEYIMSSCQASIYGSSYTPASFNLGDNIIEYSVWARALLNSDSITDDNETKETYDIPSDDFAITRGNYKKCIGLTGLNIFQTDYTTESSTKYGQNDYGKYFTSNFLPNTGGYGRPYPIAKSTWANTSLWFTYPVNYLAMETTSRNEYILKDCWHLADIIRVLLKKIAPNLTHAKSLNFSQYLYSSTNEVLGNCQIYIAPKSNILKGDYDQAAQKAEITFKDLMDMLRDCYKCYWFIDNSGYFRIEHISFFLNGMSYNEAGLGTDLTTKIDKFTKRNVLFYQKEISYDKDELYSRYEFEWMDDCTDLFGNFAIDVKSNYIQQDSTNDITISQFSSDIDYMLAYPDNFSSDGFALLMANSSMKVPIITISELRDDEYDGTYSAYIQNYYASWLNLCKGYMQDMPAKNIKYDIAPDDSFIVSDIQRCMTHSIQYQYPQDPAVYKLIKTELGEGYINSISTNIDTHLMTIELRYEPS